MRNGPKDKPVIKPYTGPSGGYGSLRSVAEILAREGGVLRKAETLLHQNKPGGFQCVSCAWGKPAKPHPFEYCENGAKATAWELTSRRVGEAFFDTYTVSELETWLDYDLEEAGRLTVPLRYDAATDKYVPVGWTEALREIGAELRAMREDPDQVVFYTSGRASLETSYMFQLLARLYGTNNLPDSSNMCHESTSVALPESIGVSVGSASLQDFEQADLMLYVAHNPGTSSPRILHQLQDAVERGAKIIGINPLRERGLERFTDPQGPKQMATLDETQICAAIHQVRVGGDIAFLTGVCKVLIERDDATGAAPVNRAQVQAETDSPGGFATHAAWAAGEARRVLDHDFIKTHTAGFEAFAAYCRASEWDELVRVSGLPRSAMEELAGEYAAAERVLAIYGMGLTQHVSGVENVQMLVNLLLLRGNLGKPGAAICPVRGHSNVQGQRTVGITEKPELAPLDTLAALYAFEPPRHKGFTTTEVVQEMISGRVRGFVALGGNFVRAVPDLDRAEAAWRKLRLTVSIATKLNRSHVLHGEIGYILPCLGRIEIDEQASGPQAVSIEDSLAHFHGSRGHVEPAGPELRSEPAIVAAIAKACVADRGQVPWDDWVGDYGQVRDAIERTYPATFDRLSERMFNPGGIARPNAVRERKWNTPNGRANFIVPTAMFAGHVPSFGQAGVLQLTTMRSNDQFNTTIYGYHDRFRGVKGTRLVVFINPADIAVLGFTEGEFVDLSTAVDDGVTRVVRALRIVSYDIPPGCCGAYFPEANPLVPVWMHDPKAHTPGYKAVPVRLARSVVQVREDAA